MASHHKITNPETLFNKLEGFQALQAEAKFFNNQR